MYANGGRNTSALVLESLPFQDGDDEDAEEEASEGSSASGTFCELEKDFSRIVREMKGNEELAKFEAEYKRLYESLYRAHKTEGELLDKCEILKDEIENCTSELIELRRKTETDDYEIEKLRNEVELAKRMTDAAHTREQRAKEMIDNLNVNIDKLNQEIERKNKLLSAQEEVPVSKQQESALKEKERMASEIETLKERLNNASRYSNDLENRGRALESKLADLREALDIKSNEFAKEKIARERAETELKTTNERLQSRTVDLESASALLTSAQSTVQKLEATAREHRATEERLRRDINDLTSRRANLQSDLERTTRELDKLELALKDRDEKSKLTQLEIKRLKADQRKLAGELEKANSRIVKSAKDKAKLESELKSLFQIRAGLVRELDDLNGLVGTRDRTIAELTKSRDTLARSNENLRDRMKELTLELEANERGRTKTDREMDALAARLDETNRILKATTLERDNLLGQCKQLSQKVGDQEDEIRLRKSELNERDKRIAEALAKHRQQQMHLEAARTECSALNKRLAESADEVRDLKAKQQILVRQIERLKEDNAIGEAAIVKNEFLLSRAEKEKQALKSDVDKARDSIRELREELEAARRDEKQLRQTVRDLEAEVRRKRRDIDDIANERDILGTQIVRRNDELSLKTERMNIVNSALQAGEQSYRERLEDIRLLKLEVKKLRSEKALLTKNIENTCDMRQEVLRLNRDLAKERLKVTALEEEIQTPLNIHRWRKLEGEDPEKYDLIAKIQILQRRILKMSSEMIDKDGKIKDTDKLYKNLCEVLAKHPGPQVAITLNKTQKALRDRGRKMKTLVSEVNMYEMQVNEYKTEMEKMKQDMDELRKKYYAQKKSVETHRARSKSAESLPSLNDQPRKKFCGGGFSMTSAKVTSAPISRAT